MNSFGERLQKFRKKRRLTQEALSISVGIEGSGKSRISKYEANDASPNLPLVLRLAKALNVEAACFFCADKNGSCKFSCLHNEK
jgi:transcriptional regulator with XRE-family HTH domain